MRTENCEKLGSIWRSGSKLVKTLCDFGQSVSKIENIRGKRGKNLVEIWYMLLLVICRITCCN